ncbi:HAD family hydrolase [Polluticaenibacter yanchengensis]|uniref:HAD family phosphatase n=1 Tax=Polluticaenibacter yanchengensis TaxID=3014562 RepID=A0ABT4UL92_9BACT|nr:HAD family phosphatase [Chitinophagaceae bacterium LY-5]
MPVDAIKYFIFDFGGIFINIHYHATRKAFIDLGFTGFDDFYSQSHALDLFEKLETGAISSTDFYNSVRHISKLPHLTDIDIETAWSAMLGDFRLESLKFVLKLKEKYPVYLLSNTNTIHFTRFENALKALTGHSLAYYFNKVYYSHEVHLRKPNADIYEYVLNDISAEAHESVFIDDTRVNIEAASKLGLATHLLLPEETVEAVFAKYI